MKKQKVQTISTSKSQAMIKQWGEGIELTNIAKGLNVRYQFVNNVVHRHCRKHNLVFSTNKVESESKKSIITKLYFDEHKEIKEIATLLKTNKSYVWQVVDNERQSH